MAVATEVRLLRGPPRHARLVPSESVPAKRNVEYIYLFIYLFKNLFVDTARRKTQHMSINFELFLVSTLFSVVKNRSDLKEVREGDFSSVFLLGHSNIWYRP